MTPKNAKKMPKTLIFWEIFGFSKSGEPKNAQNRGSQKVENPKYNSRTEIT